MWVRVLLKEGKELRGVKDPPVKRKKCHKKKVREREGKGEMEKCGILRFLYQVEL